jgi:hypothetical protein
MTVRISAFTLGALLVILLIVAFQRPDVTAQTPCAASASWVQNPSQPNFNNSPNTLCGFYQYSWQSFLYLTSPSSSGGLNFENYQSTTDVFGTPVAASAARMTDLRTKKTRVFLPRFGKPNAAQTAARSRAVAAGAPFNDDQQAKSRGVLISQSNQITYYEQLIDPVQAGFITACTLQIAACQTQPAAAPLRIPSGGIELKSSWLPMSKTAPNVGQFYTIPGFPVMNNQGTTYTPDFMALVGFHLVFATSTHKELIWATFEHIANAPTGPCTPGKAMPPPAGFKSWTYFNAADTSCKNINTWPSPAPTNPPFPITQAMLVNPSGGGSQQNVATIQSINQSVAGLLPASSVWKNYTLIGGIWTNGVLPATSGNEVGSLLIANTTMETFTQNLSCFGCHNIAANQPAFLVSHAFGAAQPGKCGYTTQLPTQCTVTQAAPPPGARGRGNP